MHSMILFQLTCKIVFFFFFVGVMLCDQLPYNDSQKNKNKNKNKLPYNDYFSFFL